MLAIKDLNLNLVFFSQKMRMEGCVVQVQLSYFLMMNKFLFHNNTAIKDEGYLGYSVVKQMDVRDHKFKPSLLNCTLYLAIYIYKDSMCLCIPTTQMKSYKKWENGNQTTHKILITFDTKPVLNHHITN